MKKPIFESEEEASDFVAFLTDCNEVSSCICDIQVEKLKTNGYIKQSELEKAKKIYRNALSSTTNSIDSRFTNYVYQLEKNRALLLNKIEELNRLSEKKQE